MQQVKLTISKNKLLEEQPNVLLFKNAARGKGRKPIMFPKKLITNRTDSNDVITFDIPQWLASKMEYEVEYLNTNNGST